MKFLFFFLFFTTLLFAKEAIVFDFGGVVGKVNRKPVLEQIACHFDLPYPQVKKALAGKHFYEALKEGQDYWQQFATSHQRNLPENWMANLDFFRTIIVTRVPGTAQIIDDLKSEGYRVALLSNTKQDRADFLRAQGYYASFDPVLLSCEIGTKKPEDAAFQLLIEQLGTAPSNIIFIDNKCSNVLAGKRNGLQAIHFTSAEDLRIELAQKHILCSE